MPDALIGCTGNIGTTLLKQRSFDCLYRSTNINEIRGRKFDVVVCAGAPAQKWIANREPDADRRNLESLVSHLGTIPSSQFILISTVDVFRDPVSVDEDTPVEEEGLHPYGLHRRMLEEFVEHRFPNHLIVRLPGLVGPGLRKNVVFDLLNDNNLHLIDSHSIFQFYPVVNLWPDIQTALRANLTLVHLTAEPISVAEIAQDGFGRKFDQSVSTSPANYDMQSIYARKFGGDSYYQYSKRETIQAVRAYAQSEPITGIEPRSTT